MTPLRIVPRARKRPASVSVFIDAIQLHEGDTLVLRCEQALCNEQKDYMTSWVKRLIPDGVKVLILDRGMSAGVIRKAAA